MSDELFSRLHTVYELMVDLSIDGEGLTAQEMGIFSEMSDSLLDILMDHADE